MRSFVAFSPVALLLFLCPYRGMSLEVERLPAIEPSADHFADLGIDEKYRPMVTACRGMFYASTYLRTGTIRKDERIAIRDVSDSEHPHRIRIAGGDCSMKFDYETGCIIEYSNKLAAAGPKNWTTAEWIQLVKSMRLADNFGLSSYQIDFDVDHPDERLHGDRLMFYRTHLGVEFLEEKMLVSFAPLDLPTPITFIGINVQYAQPPATLPTIAIDPSKALALAKETASGSPAVRRRFHEVGRDSLLPDEADSCVLAKTKWVHTNAFFENGESGRLMNPVRVAFICRLVYKGDGAVLLVTAYVDVEKGVVVGGNAQVVAVEVYEQDKKWISQ
jgi:hypothetical protein